MEKKNKIGKIRIFMLALCAVALIYMISILIDSQNDMAVCRKEFQAVTGIIPDSAFANNDYWAINLGKNINCDVFWHTERGLNLVMFQSGTLTYEQYLESRI
jgi:hypothetical protein